MKNISDPKKLKKLVTFYRIIVVFLSIVLIFTGLSHIKAWLNDNLTVIDGLFFKPHPPFYSEIKKIISPLRYSGIPDLLRPDVSIDIDFEKKNWDLRNIHRYNKNGDIVLADGSHGLCGELAVYAYEKIRPLFDNRYDITFVRAAESGYFATPKSSHIVLKIVDNTALLKKTYILDPSFKRYGKFSGASVFGDYVFFDETQHMREFEEKRIDREIPVGQATPLVIKAPYLVGLGVETIDGKFDKNNFSITLLATKKNKFVGRYLLAMRKVEGKVDIVENKFLANTILGPKNYGFLRGRLIGWFNEQAGQNPAASE